MIINNKPRKSDENDRTWSTVISFHGLFVPHFAPNFLYLEKKMIMERNGYRNVTFLNLPEVFSSAFVKPGSFFASP